MILLIVGIVIGLLGVLFGLRCYMEVRRWAHECRGTHVAVEYKRKVKMQPSLEELMLWGRKAKGGGQVFYGMGGTRIAIINRVGKPARVTGDNRDNGGPQVREGTWVATDETDHAQ